MKCPFTLSALGYKADPHNEKRFVHPDEARLHYYPVTFTNEQAQTQGDCLQMLALAAFNEGRRVALLFASLRIEGDTEKDVEALKAENTKPECMNERRRNNLPTSRSCGICGLGPCARDNLGK